MWRGLTHEAKHKLVDRARRGVNGTVRKRNNFHVLYKYWGYVMGTNLKMGYGTLESLWVSVVYEYLIYWMKLSIVLYSIPGRIEESSFIAPPPSVPFPNISYALHVNPPYIDGTGISQVWHSF